MSNKTIEFPVERLDMEDKVMWGCKACGHNITESMDKSGLKKVKCFHLV